MLHSMTGYGSAVVTYQKKSIHVEIKTLNSKSMDMNVRMHARYREHEMEVRALVSETLLRGKVDVSVWIEHTTADDAVIISQQQIQTYYTQISNIADNLSLPQPADWMTTLLRMPDVIVRNDVAVAAQTEWEEVKKALQQALLQVQNFRQQEGEALQKLFTEKIANIGRLLTDIEPYEASRTEKIRKRIEEALNDISDGDYDRNRLEQELIYYIEKLDISEEKQRLSNHLNYFLKTMEEPLPHGKKLGFITQEMGREINTTGSKSNQAEMQNFVVQMKDELEQIKEQVLNVL